MRQNNPYIDKVRVSRSEPHTLITRLDCDKVSHETFKRMVGNWDNLSDLEIDIVTEPFSDIEILSKADNEIVLNFKRELGQINISEEIEELSIETALIIQIAKYFEGRFNISLPSNKKEVHRMLTRKSKDIQTAVQGLQDTLTSNTNNRGNDVLFEPSITQDYIEFCVKKLKDKQKSQFNSHYYRNLTKTLDWISHAINDLSVEEYINHFSDNINIRSSKTQNLKSAANAFIESFGLCTNSDPRKNETFETFFYAFEELYRKAFGAKDSEAIEEQFNLIKQGYLY